MKAVVFIKHYTHYVIDQYEGIFMECEKQCNSLIEHTEYILKTSSSAIDRKSVV